MAFSHDGTYVVCAPCRAPLRLNLVSETELQVLPAELYAEAMLPGTVRCDNCGADHGTLNEAQHEYLEAVAQGHALMSPDSAPGE